MARRKRIGLFVSFPETIHVRRIFDGIRQRCEQYNYDLCVFAAGSHVVFPSEFYIKGETNIYELANFDELDGVILDHQTLTGDENDHTVKRILERLEDYKDMPKCSLEIQLGDTHLIPCDNDETMREMCRHVVTTHGKKKVCILTGTKGNDVAERRLEVYLDELKKLGVTPLPEHIIYGDFWYFAGDALADKIADGLIEKPEAVICASDCMAISFVEKLTKRGIKVPDEIMVVGFDAADEGAIAQIPISSFAPNDDIMGAEAVDYLRSIIEPDAPVPPKMIKPKGAFHPGTSCGCQTDPAHTLLCFRDMLYNISKNFADPDYFKSVDIGDVLESYSLERFTANNTIIECMENIKNSTNLLFPFRNFYLCLKENWLDVDDEQVHGYPDNVGIMVAASTVGEDEYCREDMSEVFSTADMIPKLHEERDIPSVFFFSAVHFNSKLLGYAVLQRDITEKKCINIVYRNWLRYVNSALEMIRARQRLQTISVRDEMTGAYNRRGMYSLYKQMLASAGPDASLFVGVVDMDGLKIINDTYGHHEGDFGIKEVCSVIFSILRRNEFCVRSGGDEFFIIGVGNYTKENVPERAIEFTEAMEKRDAELNKPYKFSASIGCVFYEDCKEVSLDLALSEADERMYSYKMKSRRHRSL